MLLKDVGLKKERNFIEHGTIDIGILFTTT